MAAGLETAFVNGVDPEYGTLDAWNHGLALMATAAGVVPVFSDPVYAYLVQLMQKAWRAFNNGDIGFTKGQEQQIERDAAKWFNTDLGSVLDKYVKNLIKIDARNGNPIAQNLETTPQFVELPDIFNMSGLSGSHDWYDMMTDSPGELAKHLNRYGGIVGPDGVAIYWNQIVQYEIYETGDDGGEVDGGE